MAFVGRQVELTSLRLRMDETAVGRGGIVLVSGEPGVGKTRLLQELTKQSAGTKRRVFYGRAFDLDVMPPYLPIVEALREYIRSLPEEELRSQLGEGAADVALIVPALRKRLPDLAHFPASDPGDDRHRLFESVSAFLLNIARSSPDGLLLILDDLHWADRPTLQFLVHLARSLADAPLLVVAAYRTVELDRAVSLTEALAELSREGVDARIVLGPLSHADITMLVEQAGASPLPAAIDALYRKTEGNPFFVVELLRHLQAERASPASLLAGLDGLSLPAGVRQVIAKRLARLSASANRLLEACAILGDGVSFEILAAVCDSAYDNLLDALDEAVDAGMLREEGEGYHLSHALIRQTISSGLLAPRSRRLYSRAVAAIERVHADNLDPFLGSLALYSGLAVPSVPPEEAADYAERAAAATMSVFAYEESARHLDAALALLEHRHDDSSLEHRARILIRLGELLFGSGISWPRGVACLEEAVVLLDRLGRVDDAALVHARLGHFLSGQSTMDVSRALAHLRIAEATLGHRPPSRAQGYLYHALAVAAHSGVRTAESFSASQRALAIAEELSDDELRARVLHVNGLSVLSSGELADGLTRLQQARGLALRLNLVYVLQLHSGGGIHLLTLGAPREACAWVRGVMADLEQRRAPAGLREVPLGRLGEASVAAGELGEAGRILADLAPERDPLPSQLLGACVALADGEWAAAEALAGQAREQCRRSGFRRAEWRALELLSRAAQAQGSAGKAEALLRDALEIGVSGGQVIFEVAVRARLAMLVAQDGRLDEAETHLLRCRSVLALGENWRGLAGRVALAEGIALAAAGRTAVAQRSFEQSLEVFRRYRAAWDEGEALQCWASALFAAGDRAQAAGTLAEARRVYARLGAGQPWLEAISTLERRLVSAQGAAPRYPDGLTARELDVLRLLATGESNREIAERLVLSPRTAERHVASIYRKIGARRRAEAVSYALRHELAGASTP
jgi:DNA-binding CsgD family transcriptional regulator